MPRDLTIPPQLPENCMPRVWTDIQGQLIYSQGAVFLKIDREDWLETMRQLRWLDQQSYDRLSCAMGRCVRNDEGIARIPHWQMEEYLSLVWERIWRKEVMRWPT